MAARFTNGYALVIGIGDSLSPAHSLPVSSRDAQALRAILASPERCGYLDEHIRLLTDAGATRAAIMEGLAWLAERTAGDGDATAIVFFSGHGWLSADGTYCLIPHDVNSSDVRGSAITGQEFTTALRALKARRLLVILDCCHAGGMATAKGRKPTLELPNGLESVAPPKSLLSALKEGAGRAIFSSSLDTQSSWMRRDGKLSIYTQHLIEALEGAGSQPGDTTIRLPSIMRHLSLHVPKSARALKHDQTPFFDLASEDFAVALLPAGGPPSVEGLRKTADGKGKSGRQTGRSRGTQITFENSEVSDFSFAGRDFISVRRPRGKR